MLIVIALFFVSFFLFSNLISLSLSMYTTIGLHWLVFVPAGLSVLPFIFVILTMEKLKNA